MSLPSALPNAATGIGGMSRINLGSGALTQGVVVRAITGNTDYVYMGDMSVDQTNGYPLSPGESVTVVVDDLAHAYVYNRSGSTQNIAFVGSTTRFFGYFPASARQDRRI